MIETLFSLVGIGEKCSNYNGLHSILVLLTIHRRMASLKSSTWCFKCIFDASPVNILKSGADGYLGLNIFTMQAGIVQLIAHHLMHGTVQNSEVEEVIRSRDEILHSLKFHIVLVQNKMMQFYEKKHINKLFAPGDVVYVKFHPYRQIYGSLFRYAKLSA